MRARFSLLVVVAITSTTFALALGSVAQAKQKPAPHGRPAAPTEATGSPAEQLAPVIEHLDVLLALERPENPKVAARINGAGGRVAVLKQEFVAKRAAATEPTDKAHLEAAIQTCDAITNALDERDKTLSQIHASDAVKNSSKLGERRKETISKGVEGHGDAKAVGTIVEARREQAEKREAQRVAANDHNAITAAAVNRWNQRAVELRRDINARYARIGTAVSQ